ncbi:ion transporter [Azospirillum formosense]|uniref:Ion transporter n=1 Tax=Azospirillum formosense TaxID=861533 RepID=A0ABX2KYH9_9PROT|nr:ion transporter [Azospirillum formosense]MBY3752251.1 ion transporter [Azospirillum formosense]NUB21636.1 ion transporter [Azospirillum formosense]
MEQGGVSTGPLARAGAWIESEQGQKAIFGLILLNAVVLGLDTSSTVSDAIGPLLSALDTVILIAFTAELALRIGHQGRAFFRDGWNLFDFVVVAITLAPVGPEIMVLRTLRVLRVFRLVTVMPRLRMIVHALVSSLPGLAMIVLLQFLLFYVAGVMATKLFGADFPDWFGTLGASLYSLFQIMTLESWSMGIVRPVMEVYPYAWAFFLPFILAATFTMLNLFVAVIVNALQSLQDQDSKEVGDAILSESHHVVEELRSLRAEVAALRLTLDDQRQAGRTPLPALSDAGD